MHIYLYMYNNIYIYSGYTIALQEGTDTPKPPVPGVAGFNPCLIKVLKGFRSIVGT